MTEWTMTVIQAVLVYLTIGAVIVTLLTMINMWRYREIPTDMEQATKHEPMTFRRVVTETWRVSRAAILWPILILVLIFG